MRFTFVMLFAFIFLSAKSNAQGTWTLLTNTPSHVNGGGMLLLSDGTVLVKTFSGGTDGYGNTYDKLTPSSTGSYSNGTWSSIAPMTNTRLYYSSQVLKDGRVYVAGGEYGTGLAAGEVYDPVANTWINTPAPGSNVSDANSEILDDGRVLQALVAGSLTGTLLYNPTTNTYITGPTALGIHNESVWIKLQDNSVLYINRLSTNSERYIPATNTWVADASVPVSIYDPFGDEAGGALLLPDGRAFFLGSSGNTVYYTPSGNTSPGTWTAGPVIPGAQGTPDAPMAMMVNGKILCTVSPVPTSANHFPSPTAFYEFDYTTNIFTLINAPGGGTSLAISCYVTNMLDLPDGTVLYSRQNSSQYYIYTPVGGPIAAGKPSIANVAPISGSTYRITGTLFNGISQGTCYGDDWQMSSNYPLVRLTSGSNVYYARTSNWNSTGVRRGNQADTTQFSLPAGLPDVGYQLVVVANGIASDPVSFSKTNTAFVSIALTSGSNPECSGASAMFTAIPTNGGTTPIYQWKVNGVNAGTNSTTFTTSTLTNGQIVTCVMTSNLPGVLGNPATSNAIPMTVNSGITTTVTGSLCVGSTINVPFGACGTTFTAGNIFTAQLSNAAGSFTSPTAIGTLTSATGGTIVATIPSNTPLGTGYRIRIVSSTPIVTGSDNGTNLIAKNCYCDSALYTTGCTFSPADEINDFTLSNLSHLGSGCSGGTFGYGDFTVSQPSINLIPGGNYTWTVTCPFSTNEYVSIWIDMNDNGSFGDANELIYQSTVASTTSNLTGSFTLSSSALLGNHRLRVRLTYGSTMALANSCTAYTYGEIHDYTCNINGGITTNTVSANFFCIGSGASLNVNVPYIVSGVYNAANIFTAQLSDSIGSFASPVSIGSLASTSSGTINATIPSTTSSGAGYRIRVTSSNPIVTGTDNGSNITVNASPLVSSVSIAANPSGAICTGTHVTFTATPVNGGLTPVYQWKKNSVNAGTNSSTYIDSTISNNDQFTCTMTSSLSCVIPAGGATSSAITMTVNSVSASVSIAALPSGTICAGTNVTFTATPVNGGAAPVYQWKKNGVNAGTNSITYNDNTLANNDQVMCVMTSNAACVLVNQVSSSPITTSVTASVLASVSIQVSPPGTLCSGNTVTFTAIPANGGSTPAYQWKKNNISVGTNSFIYTNNTLVTGDQITCVMTSNATCVNGSPATSAPVTMTINPVVAAGVSIAAAPSATICSGTSVTFTATPANGGTTPVYQWKKNGSNVGTNSVIYTDNALATGDQITCTMTSNALCVTGNPVTSATVIMTVNTIVTAGISIAAVPSGPICSGTSVTFTASPVNGGSTPIYQWQKNGTNVGANSITYSDNTLVNGDQISCRMTSNATCVTGNPVTSSVITMTVNAIVTASISIAASPSGSICSGTNVTFTASSVNGGTTPQYQWKKNSVNVGANSTTYNDNGLVNADQITCVLTSNATCVTSLGSVSSSPITMTVNDNLPVSVTVSISPSTTICTGTNVTFTASPVNGGTVPIYQWKKNGVVVGFNLPTYSNNALANGDQIICRLASNLTCKSGSPATSPTVTMIVNPTIATSVSIAANPAGAICSGTNVIFTATPVNGGAGPVYQWKKNGSSAGTNNTTYSDNALFNSDQVTCVMTSNAVCPVPATATSNSIVMTASACSITINLKAFIQGFYITGTDSMRAVLDSVNHPGICDTVMLQLADSASHSIVATDKKTITTRGQGTFDFTGLVPGHRYYIVFRFRTGLETWSKYSFLFSGSVMSFDLTRP